MSDFDPYYQWLGIPLQEQPASHYRLLGIPEFDGNVDIIKAAAERQTIYLRTLQAGEHAVLVAELLNEVSQARVTLLNEDQKAAYDEELRKQQTPELESEPAREQDPLAVAAEELAAVVSKPATRSRSRSGGEKPFWKESWAIPAAAGGSVVLLLLMWLFSSGEEPKGSGQEQELQAEIALLKEKLVAAGNSKVDPAASKGVDKRNGPLELAAQAASARAAAERAIILSAVTLRGHGLNVKTARFSPDGRSILSASIDKTLKLWDRKTGQLQRTFSGHAAYAESGRFSPDGKRMVSSSSDQTCKVWNVATGEEILTFTGHSSHVHSACFSPDGKRIVSGGGNAGKPGQIKVWDAQSGEEGLTIDGHSNRVWSVVFHPDGKLIVSGSEDRTVKIWNAQTSQLVRTLEGHSGTVNDVVFSSDGKRILSASADRTIMLWDVESGQLIRTFEGHTGIVDAVAFGPYNRRLASGDDRTVKIWEVDTGREILSLSGHEGHVLDVDFSPDGQQLVSGSADKTIKLWDLGSAPVQAIANTLPASLQEGLVAYYPFNGNAKDFSKEGNHAVISGAKSTDDRFDNVGAALAFNGSAFVECPFSVAPYNVCTLSAWVFVANKTPVWGAVASQPRGTSNGGSGLALSSTEKGKWELGFFAGGRGDNVGSDITGSAWQHLVGTMSGDSMAFYVNGVSTESKDMDGRIESALTPFLIGKEYHQDLGFGQGFFVGKLDDIRIYNRLLSAAEVKALYDYESTPPASSIPTASATESITNTIGMTLNKIPAGIFTMGSPEGEEGRSDHEHQHKVTISKAFYMQTTEVTQGQWKELMGTEPWKGKQYVKEGPDYAAAYVSWNEAIAYCKKLSEREGKTYSLPTEAEWEYACRAGTKTTWSFGNDEGDLGDYAWYQENAYDIDEKYAHQVELKKPNPFGLYDMHGNLWEWCSDYYGEDYYKQSPAQDPPGPASGSFRVFRGGSWLHDSRNTRSAYRGRFVAYDRYYDFGFRLVRELD